MVIRVEFVLISAGAERVMDKCPGRNRDLGVRILRCPNCKKEIEFFSDELKRNCPKCKQEVFVDKVPTCIDWCRYAKECLGYKLFNELGLKEKGKNNK